MKLTYQIACAVGSALTLAVGGLTIGRRERSAQLSLAANRVVQTATGLQLAASSSTASPCLRFYQAGVPLKFGVRNNCNECKVAVINVTARHSNCTSCGTEIRSGIKRTEVEAYKEQLIGFPEGLMAAEMIGEEPCPRH